MPDNPNLTALKAAYDVWHQSKGQRTDAWLALVADNMRIQSVGPEQPALAFAAPRRSKQEVVAYLAAITHEWQMVHYTPESYVCEGDRIAMFGRCAWTHKQTGKTAEVRVAQQWTFQNGLAVDLIEIFDSARAVAAATPG